MVQKYGTLDSEVDIEKRIECREIVKRIREFGVSQGQIMYIIKFLAQELEDRDLMISLITTINSSLGDDQVPDSPSQQDKPTLQI